jgi:transcription initiation factor TFIIH subunit 4
VGVLWYLLFQGGSQHWWISILVSLGLLDHQHLGATLTQKGFQFLLQESHLQLWEFLLSYLDYRKAGKENLEEMVTLLFQITLSKTGKCYFVENLTAVQKRMLRDLSTIGLVNLRQEPPLAYCPTRLATNMLKGLSRKDGSEYRKYIIVETNLRLYAYTERALEISLLHHFVKLTHRFSNLVVGVLSRSSVRKAFLKGITAEQVALVPSLFLVVEYYTHRSSLT